MSSFPMRRAKSPAKRRHRILSGAAVLAASLLAVACSAPAADPGGPSEEPIELQGFVAGLPTPTQIPQLHFVVGEYLGYYEEEGIDLTLEVGVQEAQAQLRQGALDLGVSGAESLLRTLDGEPDAGIQAVFLFTPSWHGLYGVLPDSDIETLADLRGKKIGTQALNLSATEAARAELASLGIDPDNDVQWVVTPSPAVMADSLESGEIDMLVYLASSSAVPVQQALGYTPRHLDHAPGFEKLTGPMFASNAGNIADPDRLVKFLRAYIRSWAFSQENPTAATEIMLKAFPELVNPGEPHEEALQRNQEMVEGYLGTQVIPEWALEAHGDRYGLIYPEAIEVMAGVTGTTDVDLDLVFQNTFAEQAHEGLDLDAARAEARAFTID